MRHDNVSDDNFNWLIRHLEPILAKHGKNTEAKQRKQVNRLHSLENKFRKNLIGHEWGGDIYRLFVDHIIKEKRNILMSRIYFRERDYDFKAKISPFFREEKGYIGLKQFHINHAFVDFVLKQKPWSENKKGRALIKVADQIKGLRNEIAECNLPLAISQAKIFLSRNRRIPQDFLDLNGVCFEGLLQGIDKYCGAYHRRFRAVLIGRMLGNLIELSSESVLHFYPPCKRKIYRARKIIGQMGKDHPVDLEEVCSKINDMESRDNNAREYERIAKEKIDGIAKKAKDDKLTTVGELANLMAAAQVLPASCLPVQECEEGGTAIERYPAGDSYRPDKMLEELEVRSAVSRGIRGLGMVDRKLLVMKGIEL